MMLFAYNLKSLRDRPKATGGALLSLAIAVFVYACTHMIVAHLSSQRTSAGSEHSIIVLSRGASAEATSRLKESDVRALDGYTALSAIEDGARGAAELVVSLRVPHARSRSAETVIVRGVTTRSFAVRSVTASSGRMLELGRDEVTIGRLARDRLERAGILQNGRLRLIAGRELPVAGEHATANQALETEVWMDLQAARAFFADASATSSYTAILREGQSFDAFVAEIAADARLDVGIERERDHYGQKTRGLALLLEGLAVLVAIVLLLAAVFGAATTMFALVRARQREVGTLKALGFQRKEILRSFLLETMVLALIGFVLGLSAASLMRYVDVAAFSGAGGEVVALVFSPTWRVAAGSLGVALVLGLLSGYVPALVASRVSPKESVRG
ncbi:MAG: ABC transporter permease [Deltaproteobacteria bacterium]|nr:ABC transporter permease [Deltaproteobacteria bacterium]